MRASKPIFFLNIGQWQVAVAVGLASALALSPWYADISLWIGAALFVIGVTIVHLRYSARFMVPFPHIALLVMALQYVIAPWLAHSYPSTDDLYRMGRGLPRYFNYAGLSLISAAIGWAVGLMALRRRDRTEPYYHPGVLRELDTLIGVGLASLVLSRLIQLPASLAFLTVLLGNLRYVGAFGWLLCKADGWKWRLIGITGAEIMTATGDGMFHTLLLFGAWTFAVWLYATQPSWRKVLIPGILGLVLLTTIQATKGEFRKIAWHRQTGDSSLHLIATWFSQLGESVVALEEGNFSDHFVGDIIRRFNQGWIVNRVIERVPATEPYAEGETLVAALNSSLLPRFLAPDKVGSSGRDMMARYAGVRLAPRTEMNLGMPGEMYANFGPFGGIIGCGLYALLFSCVSRWIYNRASRSPLWWSYLPFVGFSAVKAEDGVGVVLNWFTKAVIVIALVYACFPAMRASLAGRRAGPAAARKGFDPAVARYLGTPAGPRIARNHPLP